MSGAAERTEAFWRLVEPRLAAGQVERGTVMGRPCVRADGDFVAMPHSKTGALIVKLPADRVSELVADGSGQAFAPAGRVFKEWLAVPDYDEARWAALVEEALSPPRPS